MKTLSIIGIVLAVISFFCVISWSNPVDYQAGLGWGMFAALYLLAFSIVALVKSKKSN
jgi:uncharacterized membrane protein